VEALGQVVAGSRLRALLVVVAWVLLAAVLPLLTPGLDEVKRESGANSPVPGTQSAQAREKLLESFPDQRGTPAIIVLRDPEGLSAADEAEVARIGDALTGPGAPTGVDGVVSTATMPRARGQLVSQDGTTSMILVPITGLASSDDRFATAVQTIRQVAGRGAGGTEIRVTGPAGIATDAVEVFKNADVVLLGVTVLLVLALLVVIYRSPLLAVIPLLGVGIATRVANAVGAALADAGAISIDSSTASIMTVLLFGAGTDYALFVLMRFREELADDDDRYAAMRRALVRVGGSVLSSGGTVILALLTMLLATVPSTHEFGPFLAVGVGSVLLVALTFIPAAVLLAGRAVFWPMRHAERDLGERSLWGRVAALVAARPLPVAAAGTALLAVLGTGMYGFVPNANLISDFRGTTDSLQGQKMLEASFPPGQLAPTNVLVEAADPMPAAIAVRTAIAGIPGISPLGEPTVSADGRTARLQVVYTDDPYGTPALDRTRTVRDVAARALPDGRALVGGESANALDNRRGDERDHAGGAASMALLILGVLVLLLRAAIAPAVLLLTTALSLLAAVGATVLTWVTIGGQNGTSSRVLLYCLVFLVALGIDYNILLSARMREETAVHGFTDGIRRALTRTGGVITSAGLILAGTFAVLMTQPLNSLLQFGFAMAVGILLDTFLVRGAIVPALFHLIGPKVWYPGGPVPRIDPTAPASHQPVPDVERQ
jgi:RND superfamily putative drug exporter